MKTLILELFYFFSIEDVLRYDRVFERISVVRRLIAIHSRRSNYPGRNNNISEVVAEEAVAADTHNTLAEVFEEKL